MLRVARRLPPLESAVVAIALAVLVGLSIAQQRPARNEQQLDSYSSYDYASGGYRAYYEMLTREGFSLERFERRPEELDDGVDTLVYAAPLSFGAIRLPESSGELQALADWVRAGGRLLYLGDAGNGAAEGLNVPATEPAHSVSLAARIAPRLRAYGVASLGPASGLRWRAERRPDARRLVVDGGGALAIAYRLGRGSVTAVSDETLFSNAGISRYDRARLAYALALPRRPGGVVAFDEAIHGHLIPDRWWSIVPRPFLIALGFAACALVVAVAGAAARLGPPLIPQPVTDRSSADFIAGLANLFERAGARHKMLRDAQRSAARAVARSSGLGDEASSAVLAAAIERPELRADFFELLAAAEDPRPGARELVRGIALAQRLRKEYVTHVAAR
jgi:hypothetical protein